jgi:hypothetical protein
MSRNEKNNLRRRISGVGKGGDTSPLVTLGAAGSLWMRVQNKGMFALIFLSFSPHIFWANHVGTMCYPVRSLSVGLLFGEVSLNENTASLWYFASSVCEKLFFFVVFPSHLFQ